MTPPSSPWDYTASYLLPLTLAPTMLGVVVAVLSRLLLFDPMLNLAAGYPVFAVGQTALTDRALCWLALRAGWPAERVRGVVWLASLLLCCWLVIKRAIA